jgi:hypothetical protein
MADKLVQKAMQEILEVAQMRLSEVLERLKEYDTLIEERDKLLSIIAFADKYLEPPAPASVPVESANQGLELVSPSKTLEEKPIVLGGAEIIRELGRPMKLEEIEKEFHARRWKLSPRHGREVLRYAFNRRSDIFIKMGEGYYDLKDRRA